MREPSPRQTRAVGLAAALVLAAIWGGAAGARGQAVRSAPAPSEVSEFLRRPGDDPYSAPTDWDALPPWRQTSFFGVRVQGQVFVYVVDCSGSMGDGLRLARAKAELRRSIAALRWPQRFFVIFYNDRPCPMPGGVPQSAGPAALDLLLTWLRRIDAEGKTDLRAAMAQALALRPDAVFLLSDGEFPEGTVAAIAAANPRMVPIHAIDLTGGAAGDQLRQIARQSGGQYAARP